MKSNYSGKRSFDKDMGKIVFTSLFFLIIGQFISASDSISDNIDNKVQLFFEELSDSKPKTTSGQKNKPGNTETAITTSDLVYKLRIKELNNATPIELVYNEQVKRFIEIYTVRRKREFEKILGLTELYFPIFEEKLDKHKLPLELACLSIVESSLNPKAVSPSGAVGLWQFLFNTSKMFDLQITSYIDERCDPFLSTEAACRYFGYLYNIFNDWQLAIASFNGGPGEVRNAIEKSGGKTDFWELQPYLAKQTKDYVPAFIASYYVLNYATEHGIKIKSPTYNYFNTDTVEVKHQANLNVIANEIDIPYEELKFLNPIYKTDIVPGGGKSFLVLPNNKIVRFLRKENKIYASKTVQHNYWSQKALTGDTLNKIKMVHVVAKGEFFHKIALNYRCTNEDLKKWNGLESDYLYPGQELYVWVEETKAHLYKNKRADQNDGFIIYTVQEGDTIWSIAKKFDLKSTEELREINGNISENSILPGQKLKINW